jgi:hypothetical protein
MAPSPLQQRRTHNTLLFQKLLNLRDGASPFTLVLDTLEQSGGPVVREFARRAKVCALSHYALLLGKTPFEEDTSACSSSFAPFHAVLVALKIFQRSRDDISPSFSVMQLRWNALIAPTLLKCDVQQNPLWFISFISLAR